MPYLSVERRREWSRNKRDTRRREWLEANGPCRQCGSRDNLEVDHIDPATKADHRVWFWSAEHMLAELAKCQVLCDPCHLAKSIAEGTVTPATHGTKSRFLKGCRCEECHAAYLRNIRRQRAQRKERARKAEEAA